MLFRVARVPYLVESAPISVSAREPYQAGWANALTLSQNMKAAEPRVHHQVRLVQRPILSTVVLPIPHPNLYQRAAVAVEIDAGAASAAAPVLLAA